MSRGYLFAFVFTLMFHCLKIVTQQIYSLIKHPCRGAWELR